MEVLVAAALAGRGVGLAKQVPLDAAAGLGGARLRRGFGLLFGGWLLGREHHGRGQQENRDTQGHSLAV